MAEGAKSTSVNGTISVFDRVQGFGVITTSEGRELRFDVGVCRFGDPRVGEAVRFQIGPSRLGGERVVWVERPQAGRLARASIAPAAAPLADAVLHEAVSRADGSERALLEELVRRRTLDFRARRALWAAIEHLEALAGGGQKAAPAEVEAIVAELREVYLDLSQD
jgi:cold shock CspA family protein